MATPGRSHSPTSPGTPKRPAHSCVRCRRYLGGTTTPPMDSSLVASTMWAGKLPRQETQNRDHHNHGKEGNMEGGTYREPSDGENWKGRALRAGHLGDSSPTRSA